MGLSPKMMNFYAMCWFISVLICLVIEGSYMTAAQEGAIFNQLIPFTVIKVGGVVPIPCFNLSFFNGVMRILLWDFSFYYGGYEIIQWIWRIMLIPGAIWGLISFFTTVFAEFVRVF